ncbi:coagulation factor X-like [Anabrus simplex]|uniref:coagulation factor X-like n=1 Tax=Anabrus simplex TaxID=316456 RepID=UPI0035A395F0
MGDKIVNGNAAQKNQLPYQVLIEDINPESNIVCGGTLINSGDGQKNIADFVLTAAHCVQRPNTTAILITAGVIDRYNVHSHLRKVTEVYFYKRKKEEVIENDIALLKCVRIIFVKEESGS